MRKIKDLRARNDIIHEIFCSSTIDFLHDHGVSTIRLDVIRQNPKWFSTASRSLEEIGREVRNRFGSRTIYVVGSFNDGFYYAIKKSAPL